MPRLPPVTSRVPCAPLTAATTRVICVGVGAGQPASLQVRTMAALVSKYTCQ